MYDWTEALRAQQERHESPELRAQMARRAHIDVALERLTQPILGTFRRFGDKPENEDQVVDQWTGPLEIQFVPARVGDELWPARDDVGIARLKINGDTIRGDLWSLRPEIMDLLTSLRETNQPFADDLKNWTWSVSAHDVLAYLDAIQESVPAVLQDLYPA